MQRLPGEEVATMRNHLSGNMRYPTSARCVRIPDITRMLVTACRVHLPDIMRTPDVGVPIKDNARNLDWRGGQGQCLFEGHWGTDRRIKVCKIEPWSQRIEPSSSRKPVADQAHSASVQHVGTTNSQERTFPQMKKAVLTVAVAYATAVKLCHRFNNSERRTEDHSLAVVIASTSPGRFPEQKAVHCRALTDRSCDNILRIKNSRSMRSWTYRL